MNKTFHCFFEQSGTFKNEFKRLGYEAFDYDIRDDFGETDKIIDLFEEINKAFANQTSIFDKIKNIDTIIAFFPCIRFEDQIQMHFRGTAYQMRNWTDEQKLEYDLKLHSELSELYNIITKLALVCIRKKLALIIENPHSATHYLVKYWAIPSTIIDKDRSKRGDCYKKPTQYWFINCKAQQNMILEAYTINERKTIKGTNNTVERSMITSEYANRFIREFILEKKI